MVPIGVSCAVSVESRSAAAARCCCCCCCCCRAVVTSPGRGRCEEVLTPAGLGGAPAGPTAGLTGQLGGTRRVRGPGPETPGPAGRAGPVFSHHKHQVTVRLVIPRHRCTSAETELLLTCYHSNQGYCICHLQVVLFSALELGRDNVDFITSDAEGRASFR